MTVEKVSRQCPSCGEGGKMVNSITLTSHLSDAARAGLDSTEGFVFCSNSDCEVSYFGPQTFPVSDVELPIFQKSTDPNRLVCYCFKHSVAEIKEEIATTGSTTVLASIRENCKKGFDECERNNPQGSCCLGNVTRVIKSSPSPADMREPEGEDSACCATSDETK